MTLLRKKPKSAARDRLASAIEARRDLQAELQAISASLARLSALASEPAKIEAAISKIDASGAEALTAWATSGEGVVPTPNAEKRAELVADLSVARASAGAAEKGYAGVAATYTAVTARTKAHDDAITAATIAVMIEELGPLAEETEAAAKAYAGPRR